MSYLKLFTFVTFFIAINLLLIDNALSQNIDWNTAPAVIPSINEGNIPGNPGPNLTDTFGPFTTSDGVQVDMTFNVQNINLGVGPTFLNSPPPSDFNSSPDFYFQTNASGVGGVAPAYRTGVNASNDNCTQRTVTTIDLDQEVSGFDVTVLDIDTSATSGPPTDWLDVVRIIARNDLSNVVAPSSVTGVGSGFARIVTGVGSSDPTNNLIPDVDCDSPNSSPTAPNIPQCSTSTPCFIGTVSCVGTVNCNVQVSFNQPISSFVVEYHFGEISDNGGNPADQLIGLSDVNWTDVPVTLAYFTSGYEGGGLKFRWTTATELQNIGFNLYGLVNGEKVRLNNEPISTLQPDSVEPQYYEEIVNGAGNLEGVLISSIDIKGVEEFFGPFDVGEEFGKELYVEPVDWYSINQEYDSRMAQKGYAQIDGEWKDTLATTVAAEGGAFVATKARRRNKNKSDSSTVCNVEVSEEGMHRVTYEEFEAAGCDFNGERVDKMAVSYKGQAVARHIVSGQDVFSRRGDKFKSGGHIDFYAELPSGADELYLKKNIYQIQVNGSLVKNSEQLKGSEPGASFYYEKSEVEKEVIYGQTSPNGDPWAEKIIFAFGSPRSSEFIVNIGEDIITEESGVLKIWLWGQTAFKSSPDHHVKLYLNGDQIADEKNDGVVDWVIEVPLSPEQILPGDNEITVEVVGDNGEVADFVAVDKYEIRYARPVVAIGAKLLFDGNTGYEVEGFSSENLVGYVNSGGTLYMMTGKKNSGSGENGYYINVGGSGKEGKYWVSTVDNLLKGTIFPARKVGDLLNSSAEYLVIAHPNFIGPELDSYISAKSSEYSVKVVNLFDIYAAYGYGMATPFAIRDYLEALSGVEYVLLVGGGSYDYHDNTGTGVLTFIPTIYEKSNERTNFSPSDGSLVDFNGDNVPEKMIGRWPCRTEGELSAIIEKTLNFENKKNALIIADEGGEFIVQADTVLGALPWYIAEASTFVEGGDDSEGNVLSSTTTNPQIKKVYIEEIMSEQGVGIGEAVNIAKGEIVETINDGVGVTIFTGHGSPVSWSNMSLMTATDAMGLSNFSDPTLIVPLACYTTYYLTPSTNTLSHQLMNGGGNGAVAVSGAATLSNYSHNGIFARSILQKMFEEEKTLGQAVLETKQENSGLIEQVIGWETLGDPTLRLEP